MKPKLVVMVVIPCHFESRHEFCETTRKRLELALCRAGYHYQDEVFFILTGNVPYIILGRTLAGLMKEHLVTKGVSEKRITIAEGVGIFSEARNVVAGAKRQLPECQKIIIFSSDWYFWPGKVVWKKAAKKHSLEIEAVPVYGTGGWRTRLLYTAYGGAVKAASLIGQLSLLGKALTAFQKKRIHGFTFNGCA